MNLRNTILSEKKQVIKAYIQMLTFHKVKKTSKTKQYCLGIHTNVIIYEIKKRDKIFRVADGRECRNTEASSNTQVTSIGQCSVH